MTARLPTAPLKRAVVAKRIHFRSAKNQIALGRPARWVMCAAKFVRYKAAFGIRANRERIFRNLRIG